MPKCSIWVFPKNNGIPKSSILIRFSIINHPFWGTPIFGNTHILGFAKGHDAGLEKSEPNILTPKWWCV